MSPRLALDLLCTEDALDLLTLLPLPLKGQDAHHHTQCVDQHRAEGSLDENSTTELHPGHWTLSPRPLEETIREGKLCSLPALPPGLGSCSHTRLSGKQALAEPSLWRSEFLASSLPSPSTGRLLFLLQAYRGARYF